ncbi:MAG: hypothetical protein AB9Q22_10085 [Candidatus Reddybacter sp.]
MSWFARWRLRVMGVSWAEIQCGMCRTGPWFESVDDEGASND